MNVLLLLFISILPVYLVGRYVYRKDNFREPKGLIIKLFCGGLGAFGVTIAITIILGFFFPSLLSETFDTDLISLFFHVFFGIALVEEFSKWIFLYKIGFNNEEFDQVYDMIVYGVFVALGFACIENIFYVFQNGFGTGIIRGLLAVPGHACDGVFMGYYLSMAKVSEVKDDSVSKKNNILFSILVPVSHNKTDYSLRICYHSRAGYFLLGDFCGVRLFREHQTEQRPRQGHIRCGGARGRWSAFSCPRCSCRISSPSAACPTTRAGRSSPSSSSP